MSDNDVLEKTLDNEPLGESTTDYGTLELPKYKYPDWYNEKTHGFYKQTIVRLQKLFDMNVETAKYYDKLNLFIFGPSISITALCSMASFLSTTDLMSDDSKTGFGIAVGILSVVSTALQSVAGTCQYKSRGEAFRISADKYEQLLTKLRFEQSQPRTEDFMEKLEEQILEVQQKNTYFPPQKISEKYKFIN
jgi:hypothetical protein